MRRGIVSAIETGDQFDQNAERGAENDEERFDRHLSNSGTAAMQWKGRRDIERTSSTSAEKVSQPCRIDPPQSENDENAPRN